MDQIIAAPCARITALSADKFKRYRISVNFINKNNRETATACALLPYLLERGYQDYPDMTQLSKHLAKLYGAELSVHSFVSGANRVLSVSVSGIKNEFALKGENLAKEYLSLAFGVAFRPHFIDSMFDSEALLIEREKLRETLESEINEKRSYCIKQARRKFFKSAAEGVENNGYLDEIDLLTLQTVTDAYNVMLQTANIEVLAFGVDTQIVNDMLCAALSNITRLPQPLHAPSAQGRVVAQKYDQPIDAEQGKLCLLFTSGEPIPREDYYKVRTAVALLGATPTSRLFMNVREKQSLCYYCAAGFVPVTGLLCVDSGIEHDNAEKTRDAVLKEINTLKTELVSDKELADTKRCLCNNIASVSDTLSSLENWYLGEIITGSLKSPSDAANEINNVTKEDIKKSIELFSLSVEYVLSKKGGK